MKSQPNGTASEESRERYMSKFREMGGIEFLTGGSLDVQDGRFLSRSGDHKYYFSTDNLKSTSYRGLLVEDLMDILVQNGSSFVRRRRPVSSFT